MNERMSTEFKNVFVTLTIVVLSLSHQVSVLKWSPVVLDLCTGDVILWHMRPVMREFFLTLYCRKCCHYHSLHFPFPMDNICTVVFVYSIWLWSLPHFAYQLHLAHQATPFTFCCWTITPLIKPLLCFFLCQVTVCSWGLCVLSVVLKPGSLYCLVLYFIDVSVVPFGLSSCFFLLSVDFCMNIKIFYCSNLPNSCLQSGSYYFSRNHNGHYCIVGYFICVSAGSLA